MFKKKQVQPQQQYQQQATQQPQQSWGAFN